MPLKDIPGVPTDLATPVRNLLLALREHVRELRGLSGNPGAAALTVADSDSVGGGAGTPGPPGPPGPAGDGSTVTPDLTPPPTPTGVSVVGGIDYVGFTTDAPVFTQGHGYGSTRVFGAKRAQPTDPAPVFSNAVLVHEYVGRVGSFATEPKTTWHLWFKWVSNDGVESTTPAGGTNGYVAITGNDVGKLLEALSGQITESQLYATLGQRLDLIDGPGSLAGSVNARVEAEAAARGQALLDEAAQRATGDNALQTQINTLVATGSSDTQAVLAALQDEQAARIAGDAAEATSRQTLAAQLRGNYNGTDPSQLVTGLLYNERQVRISEDQALSSSISNLSATVNNNLSTVNASIAAEQTARASGDAANAASITNVNARLNSGGDTYSSIVTAQSTASAAQTTANSATNTANTAASNVLAVQSRIDNGNASPFEPFIGWDFSNSSEGWTFSQITAAPGTTAIALQATGPDPLARSPVISVPGGVYDKVRMRVRRDTGTGWDGILFYTTAGHGESASFYKAIPDTTIAGQYVILEWDMTALNAGTTDWISNTITGIRVDLGNSAADKFTVDWISIGRRGIGANYAAVQQEISTRASETGYLGAQYTLRITAGNIIGGFGISGTSAPGAGATIDFGIRANRFFVAPPEGVGGVPSIVPFVVQATATTTPAGEVLPAGVYMDAAYIRNLEAVLGRFQQAIITNAMIQSLAASKLTAGSIGVGESIQSTGYSAGVTGWRIGGNGFAEFGAASIRGQLTAAQIDTRNLDIKDGSGNVIFSSGVNLSSSRVSGLGSFAGLSQINAGNVSTYIAAGAIGNAYIGNFIQSDNYAAGASGWRIDKSGAAEFDAATIRGKLTTNQIQVGAVNLAYWQELLAVPLTINANPGYMFPADQIAAQREDLTSLLPPDAVAMVSFNGYITITMKSSGITAGEYDIDCEAKVGFDYLENTNPIERPVALFSYRMSHEIRNNTVFRLPINMAGSISNAGGLNYKIARLVINSLASKTTAGSATIQNHIASATVSGYFSVTISKV